jgi:acyl dehydratase
MRLAELSPIGERIELDTIHFSAEDIIRFAEKYDPQTFHLDAEAAKDSVLGGPHGCAAFCLSGSVKSNA